MARERVGEEPLVAGFVPVVELLGQPLTELLDERSGIEAGKHHAEHSEEQVGVHEVGADGFVDAGILHLHRDHDSGLRDRAVHLPDRRRRDGLRVPFGEHDARVRRRAPRARPPR